MERDFRIVFRLGIGFLIVSWLTALTVVSHAQAPRSSVSQLSVEPGSVGFVRDYEELVPTIPTNPEPAGWRAALGVISSLVLVVIAIYGTLWGIKTFLLRKGPAAVRTGWIRIWETVHLSPHRTLYLVEINGRLFILGATDHQVSLLTELDRSAIGEQSPFAAQLAQVVGEPIMSDLPAKISAAFDGLRGVMNRLRDVGDTEGA